MIDDREHVAFDKYINPGQPSNLPSTTVRRLNIGVRTAYTTFLCILGAGFWQWGGIGTYISPTLSAISSVLYFGLWQSNIWALFYSVVIGGGIGIAIGELYNFPVLMLILLFLALTWCNCCSIWDRSPKVFASLSVILATMWPMLTKGAISGVVTVKYLVTINMFPFLLTGVSLLIPWPALAADESKIKVESVCRKLSLISFALIRAFCAQDFVDLYSAEIDHLQLEVDKDLELLLPLIKCVENEAIFFPSLLHLSATLKSTYLALRNLADTFAGIRDVLQNITNNKTQAKFVEALHVPLEDFANELTIALKLVCEQVESFHAQFLMFPRIELFKFRQIETGRRRTTNNTYQGIRHAWESSHVLLNKRLSELKRRKFELAQATTAAAAEGAGEGTINLARPCVRPPTTSSSTRSVTATATARHQEYLAVISRLYEAQSDLFAGYARTRQEYVWRKPTVVNPNPVATDMETGSYVPFSSSLSTAPPQSSDNYFVDDPQPETDHYELRLRMRSQAYHMNHNNKHLLLDNSAISHHKHHDFSIDDLNQVMEENQSLRHMNPRGAYLHRFTDTIKIMEKSADIFTVTGNPFSFVEFCVSNFVTIRDYLVCSVVDVLWVFNWFKIKLCGIVSCSCGEYATIISDDDVAWFASIRRKYIQAIKISLAITLTSLFVVIKQFRVNDLSQNGLWATIVIALIRQESTSSSFLMGYQRLEGTVIGAIYSFALYQALGCAQESCSHGVSIAVLVPWLGLCAFFREGPRHGYAALVAGFTPIVLFMGPVSGTVTGAWLRVERTFFGIAIYLLVDNLFFANRTDTAIRMSVLMCLDDSATIFHQSLEAVRHIISADKMAAHMQEMSIQSEANKIVVADREQAVLKLEQPTDDTTNSIPIAINDYNGQLQSLSSSSSPAMDVSDVDVELAVRPTVASIFDICTTMLANSDICLNRLRTHVQLQDQLLKIVVHEPEIWHRSFPIAAYCALLESFTRIWRSGCAVNSGIKAMEKILIEMVKRGEDASKYLLALEYMSSHIFEVANKANHAMSLASQSLHSFYEDNNFRADLTAIITLSKTCDKLMVGVDAKFRAIYRSRAIVLVQNMEFLIAWQNLFESICDLVKNLSSMGLSLHAVRDVEALSAV